jgi:hypothetical protein
MDKKNILIIKNYFAITIFYLKKYKMKYVDNKYLKMKNYILYILKNMVKYYVDHHFNHLIK